MNLDALLHRAPAVPFASGSRIPWDEPVFSARMLREHLSQAHDRASRRSEVIARQAGWLDRAILAGPGARVLDLGCGPGLHASRIARAGHRVVGIDFSPAAIAYARDEAERDGLACTYRLEDVREAELGTGFDAVCVWFGEFNTFSPDEARDLLARIRAALAPGGRVVLELHDADYVRALGEAPPTWSAHASGLFADEPHLALRESRWHADRSATTERTFVLRPGAGAPDVYTQSTQAYDDDALDAMCRRAGLFEQARYESLTGREDDDAELFGWVLARDDAPAC